MGDFERIKELQRYVVSRLNVPYPTGVEFEWRDRVAFWKDAMTGELYVRWSARFDGKTYTATASALEADVLIAAVNEFDPANGETWGAQRYISAGPFVG